MESGILGGSIVLIMAWLLVGGLGIPLPEDVALISAGVLANRGVIHPVVAMLAVFAGVIGGDALLFFTARHFGPRAYDHRLIRRLLPPHRRERIEIAYRRYGGRLVFLARHVVGLRGAVFAMAGIHGMAPRKFLLWDALAACISVPVVVGLGYFGSAHVERMRHGIARTEHYVLLVAVVLVVGFLGWRHTQRLRAATNVPRTEGAAREAAPTHAPE
ncbi:MAG: DedA family protein [Kofleriaceae bacterium]